MKVTWNFQALTYRFSAEHVPVHLMAYMEGGSDAGADLFESLINDDAAAAAAEAHAAGRLEGRLEGHAGGFQAGIQVAKAWHGVADAIVEVAHEKRVAELEELIEAANARIAELEHRVAEPEDRDSGVAATNGCNAVAPDEDLPLWCVALPSGGLDYVRGNTYWDGRKLDITDANGTLLARYLEPVAYACK